MKELFFEKKKKNINSDPSTSYNSNKCWTTCWVWNSATATPFFSEFKSNLFVYLNMFGYFESISPWNRTLFVHVFTSYFMHLDWYTTSFCTDYVPPFRVIFTYFLKIKIVWFCPYCLFSENLFVQTILKCNLILHVKTASSNINCPSILFTRYI